MYRGDHSKSAVFRVLLDCFVSFLSIVRVVAPLTVKGEGGSPVSRTNKLISSYEVGLCQSHS